MYNYTSDPNVIYPDDKMQEDNPSGKFKQMTYNIQNNSQFSSFDKAFARNTQLIEKTDFHNKNDIIHNNLGENLQNQYVTEYVIDIDSKNRDTSAFPNPFKYTVTFAPTAPGFIIRNDWIDPSNHSLGKHQVKTPTNGTPEPHIGKIFRNIKYIRVDNVILPKYTQFDPTNSYAPVETSNLSNERYIVMKLKNIESQYNLSTNHIIETSGIKLIPDVNHTGSYFFYTVPTNARNVIKTYNTSSLGNLDKLYVEFYDSYDNPLSYNLGSYSGEYADPLFKYYQNNITMVIGVIENELATDVNFSR